MKYEIKMNEGCTSYSILINGVNIHDLKGKEKEEFVDYLLATIKENIKDNSINLESVIETLQYDEFISDKRICDQCGDTTSSTIWRI